MQTTLMGLAIALILALLTALVGPYFVNWNDYRETFEAEASRIVGLSVRVAGDIDVRVLPFPSVKLVDIEIGPAGKTSRLRARSLGIEFGLGPLLRGELRAVEMRLVAPQVSLGLNSLGQVDWPATALAAETLAIDRLKIDDGRVVLTDASSDARLNIEKFTFSGDVRSLTGPFRGSGTFAVAGVTYGYRVAAGRFAADGIKVKLALDDSERPLNAELDGTLAFERAAPRFDGSLKLWRPAGAVQASGRVVAQEPWRVGGRVNATSQMALIEQVTFQYGPEERAVSLEGSAQFKFGAEPRLQGALSARQVDLDRLIATPEAPRRPPFAAIQNFADLFSAAIKPAVPVNLSVSVDAVTLGGALIQNVGTDLRSDADGWRIGKLDFRAPGFSQVRLSGRLIRTTAGLSFTGATDITANDPRSLVAWLAGRGSLPAQIRPLRLAGELALGADRIAVERLQATLDRGSIEGRLVYLWPGATRPARLEAELSAGELDLDAVLQFGKSALAGLDLAWPREVVLALDVERARLAGFEARKAQARLKFDADGIAIERLSIADFGNATIEASGRLATTAQPGGNIAIELDARDLSGVIAVTEKFAPALSGPLKQLAGRQNSAKLNVTVGLDRTGTGNATGRLAIVGRVGAFRLDIGAGATGKPADFAWSELNLTALTGAQINAALESDDGNALLALIGFDRFATAEPRPARLSVSASGPLGHDTKIEVSLAAGPIRARAKGKIQLPEREPAVLTFDDVSGNIGGSEVRGDLTVKFADAPQLDGTIEVDTLDAPAAIAVALGMPLRRTDQPGAWPSEPFRQIAAALRGRIEFQAQRASISPTLTAQQLGGVLAFGPSRVTIEDIAGNLAGGRLTGRLEILTDRDGVKANARVALSNVDVTAFAGRAALGGKLSFQAQATGAGLSPAAFIGSVAGTGTIALDNARLAGLNPRLFDAVMRAVEIGMATDSARIRDFVATSLDTGDLPVEHVEAAVAFKNGHARIADVTIRSGVELTATANVNLADATLDAVLTLTGTVADSGAIRPMVFVMLKGPLLQPARSIEADALASWLALRAIEQQSKRLDAMARPTDVPPDPPPADTTNSLPSLKAATSPVDVGELPRAASAPPLPPAINVLPAPRPRGENLTAPQVRPSQTRPVPQNPAPAVPGRPLDLFGAQR